MTYEHDEQEQIEALKRWWKAYGTSLLAAIALVSAVYLGWTSWSASKTAHQEQASQHFMELLQAIETQGAADVEAKAKMLREQYGKTVYADMGSLLAARTLVEQKNYTDAKVPLQWVIENSHEAPYKQVAQARLTRLLIEAQAYDDALALLSTMSEKEGYKTLIEELKGDVYRLKNEPEKAKAAYQAAVSSAPEAVGQRPWLQMKLEDLE